MSIETLTMGVELLLIALISATIIIVWNWRFMLIGLVAIQVGVARMALTQLQIPSAWLYAQTLVLVLCALILALSGVQATDSRRLYQSGNWFLRLLLICLFIILWQIFDIQIELPTLSSGVSRLSIWLSLSAFLILSLTDHPLYTGSALLLWCIPIQILVAVLLPLPGLLVLIGILELLLALGCSYLILTESFVDTEQPIVVTDITFPTDRLPPLEANRYLSYSEMTTMDIPAVKVLPEQSFARSQYVPAAERTGEHPLVARINRRRQSQNDPATGQFPRVSPLQTLSSSESGSPKSPEQETDNHP
ncbi:hypothetical protein KFU94_18755 [Chloroflexi bacterium TSY]|nr:hypothetical protein [Chloroflexi bacterium TSY]